MQHHVRFRRCSRMQRRLHLYWSALCEQAVAHDRTPVAKKAVRCSPLLWYLVSSPSFTSLARSCIDPFIKISCQRRRRRPILHLPTLKICTPTLTVATAYSAIIVACSKPKAFWRAPPPVNFFSLCVTTFLISLCFSFHPQDASFRAMSAR